MKTIGILVIAAALFGGCNSQPTPIPTMGTFSCDITSGGTHKCIDNTWSGDVYSTDTWASQCMSNMGTPGMGCSHTGAVGGCQSVTTTSTDTLTETEWFYSGDAGGISAACAMAGGMFVAP